MGCGSSKSASVAPAVQIPEAWSPNKETNKDSHVPASSGMNSTSVEEKPHTESKKGTETSIIKVKEVPGSCDSLPTESNYGSSESISSSNKITDNSSSTIGNRNGSAKSNDSGLGGDYARIITEKSSPTLKEVVAVPEELPELNLAIDGKKLKTPGPIGHRKRTIGKLPPVHEKTKKNLQMHSSDMNDPFSLEVILQKRVKFADKLINELPATSSIIKRPVSRSGVAFDIFMNGTEDKNGNQCSVKKPPCVLKYAQHKRAADVVTHAELDEKQKAADQRRKVRKVKHYSIA